MAAAVTQPGVFNVQEFTDLSLLMGAGRLYTYAAGTTNFKTAYTEPTGTTAHTYTADGTGLPNGQYIALNARGELPAPLYLLDDGPYDLALKTAAGATVWTRRSASIGNALSGSAASQLLPYQADNDSELTTIAAKLRESISVVDRGAVADGTTDNTAAILASALLGPKMQTIPYNVKFNRTALLSDPSFPPDVAFIDMSGINDYTAAGESTKHFGITSGDEATDDTTWAVNSGHHPFFMGNNHGWAGTTSGDNRLFSIVWAGGQYALGAADKRGWRANAILQFRKESSTTWSLGLRSLAPWPSIAGRYEGWVTGQVISGAGVYRVYGDNHYVSTGAGTTGATPPTHTSGTVSDGAVSWTWLDSSDRGIFLVDQYGRWLIGNGSLSTTWRHKVTPTDPTQAYVGELVAGGTSQSSNLKLTPTDSGGAEDAQPFLQATEASGLTVVKSDGSSSLVSFLDTGMIVGANGSTAATPDTATGATPSVAGRNTYYIGNAGAQSITGFTGGFDGQRVRVIVTNANTSFTHSVTFRLGASSNIATPAAFSVIDFEKVPASISDAWIETGRSLK